MTRSGARLFVTSTALVTALAGCGEVEPAPVPSDGGSTGGDGGLGSCSRVVRRADHDGDGYLANDPSAPESCGDLGFPGYAPILDCDDADATANRIGYRDADGDRCVLPEESMCVGAGTPGFTIVSDPTSQGDCNDQDAALCRPLYRDLDGDGFGGEALCVPATPGLIAWGYDCDDSNADRHPGRTELWGDGFDADCDETDGATSCPGSGPSVATDFPVDTTCLGPDVFIAADSYCTTCVGINYSFILGNRGSAPAVGLLEVSGNFEPSLALPIDLAPGGLLPAITVYPPGMDVSVSFTVEETEECSLENNTFSYGRSPCP